MIVMMILIMMPTVMIFSRFHDAGRGNGTSVRVQFCRGFGGIGCLLSLGFFQSLGARFGDKDVA